MGRGSVGAAPSPPNLPPLPKAWSILEKAEHEREVALRDELIRQEKLERLAQRFDHKAAMRETWLNENQRLVSQVGERGQGAGVWGWGAFGGLGRLRWRWGSLW